MAAQPNRHDELPWLRSTYSTEDDACVEVVRDGAFVLVRDSKDSNGGILELSPGTWGHLLVGAGRRAH
ncbi:DUF397 domain-containing protein [Actinocorallia lasiicapitis]